MKTSTKFCGSFKRTCALLFFSALICNTSLCLSDRPEYAKAKKNLAERFGYAVWYSVPVNSLAHRRAKGNEFTAAHNHLPLGTLVRVTRTSNGRSVLVRITDRGITNRRATIDVCKEAAEELGILREGFSRVKIEIIPELPVPNAPDTDSVAAH
jgi:rare lipoprotein A (peptidoglycan hydrolase)